MFEKIKEFFMKKEETSKKMSIEELESYIQTKKNDLINQIEHEIDEQKKEVFAKINELGNHLQILEKAELRNPKIPEREKHFMQGNRTAYIRSVNSFINGLRLEKVDNNNISAFYQEFSRNLEALGRGSARQYIILQEFFANESKDVAIILKEIDRRLKQMASSSKFDELNKLMDFGNRMNELKHRKTKLDGLINENKAMAQEMASLEKERKILLKKLKEIKSSKDFGILKEMEKDKEALNKKFKDNELAFLNDFNALESALKKYERITIVYQGLIAGYIANPTDAILHDKNLELLALIEKLMQNLDKLEIKDKKKEKLLIVTEKMNREYLQIIQAKLLESKKEIHEVTRRIISLSIAKDEEEINAKLAEIENKISSKKSFAFEEKIRTAAEAVETQKKDVEDGFISFGGTLILE